jgi:DNA topoisomerase-1
LLIRSGRFGRFISCSGYPECDFKKPFFVKTGAICPECGGDLVERKSRKSAKIFFGCSNYPTCTYAIWDRPLAVPCPECAGLLTLGAGKTEAQCVKCGALVRGAQEGLAEVVGHRAPDASRATRTSANGSRASTRARRTTSTTGGGAHRSSAAEGATTKRSPRRTAGIRTPATRAPSGAKRNVSDSKSTRKGRASTSTSSAATRRSAAS